MPNHLTFKTVALPMKDGERERLHKVGQFVAYQGFATDGWVGRGSP